VRSTFLAYRVLRTICGHSWTTVPFSNNAKLNDEDDYDDKSDIDNTDDDDDDDDVNNNDIDNY
jgi:hypothetical protein